MNGDRVPADIFVDRRGMAHVPEDGAVLIPRIGAFAICRTNGRVLLSWPANAELHNMAELPGGGMEGGETLWQALLREIEEETGLAMQLAVPRDPVYHHRINYYAENSLEYWQYDQTYYLLEGADIDSYYFEGFQETPDGGRAAWVSYADLETEPLHFVHKNILGKVL